MYDDQLNIQLNQYFVGQTKKIVNYLFRSLFSFFLASISFLGLFNLLFGRTHPITKSSSFALIIVISSFIFPIVSIITGLYVLRLVSKCKDKPNAKSLVFYQVGGVIGIALSAFILAATLYYTIPYGGPLLIFFLLVANTA